MWIFKVTVNQSLCREQGADFTDGTFTEYMQSMERAACLVRRFSDCMTPAERDWRHVASITIEPVYVQLEGDN